MNDQELKRRQIAFNKIKVIVAHLPTLSALAVVTSFLTVKEMEKLAKNIEK